jgi:hypothetical protein
MAIHHKDTKDTKPPMGRNRTRPQVPAINLLLWLDLLINFNVSALKDSIQRIVND